MNKRKASKAGFGLKAPSGITRFRNDEASSAPTKSRGRSSESHGIATKRFKFSTGEGAPIDEEFKREALKDLTDQATQGQLGHSK